MKDINIIRLKPKQILVKNGFSKDQVRNLPDTVCEALLSYSVNDMIDKEELEGILNLLGFGLGCYNEI